MADLSSFHEAVKRGDLSAVQAALAADHSLIDQPNATGQTAFLLAKYYRQEGIAAYLLTLEPSFDLFLACVAGKLDLVQSALANEPSQLEGTNNDGWTPLHLAAFFGHSELADYLLDRGAAIDGRSTNIMKNTPLHAAVAGRKLPLIELLLKHGADVNARQEGGWTALQAAAQNGDQAMVELLLAHDADVSARADNNQTALDLALLQGHAQVAALLEELGAR